MESWNNSWMKNLPVRPLTPRRKTPGQLYPISEVPWARPTSNELLIEITHGTIRYQRKRHRSINKCLCNA